MVCNQKGINKRKRYCYRSGTVIRRCTVLCLCLFLNLLNSAFSTILYKVLPSSNTSSTSAHLQHSSRSLHPLYHFLVTFALFLQLTLPSLFQKSFMSTSCSLPLPSFEGTWNSIDSNNNLSTLLNHFSFTHPRTNAEITVWQLMLPLPKEGGKSICNQEEYSLLPPPLTQTPGTGKPPPCPLQGPKQKVKSQAILHFKVSSLVPSSVKLEKVCIASPFLHKQFYPKIKL